MGENKNLKLPTKYTYVFNNWKKNTAYRYLFSMSDEESDSASEFYIIQSIPLKRPCNK